VERLAFGAGRVLWADPGGALQLFAKRLQPARPLDPRQLQLWLADLDSNDFQVREAAAQQLERAPDRVEAPLQRVIIDRPALETRRRIEAILDRRTLLHRQRSRAVELLEKMETPAARRLLESLANGHFRAELTFEARSALCRLDKQSWQETLAEPGIVIEEYEPIEIVKPIAHDRECHFPVIRRP
jgi:HEAT repeat protein